jgi:putative polyhydroxyalkanoate system protein
LAHIHITREHSLGLAEARKLAFKWAEAAEEKLHMECNYEEGQTSDLVSFTRTGVNGELKVTKDQFELDARLGFLLGVQCGSRPRSSGTWTSCATSRRCTAEGDSEEIGAEKGPTKSLSAHGNAASRIGTLAGSGPRTRPLIAGPFAAKTLADFGADVVRSNPARPEAARSGGGDPLRKWRLLKDGTSVWWQVQSRNKRSCLDLKDPTRRTSCAGWRGTPTC